MQYPFSPDEQAAMMRYLTGIRKQLQDVSDLFSARYGRNSNVAEMAVKALVSSTLLEHEVMLLQSQDMNFQEAGELARSMSAAC